VQAQLTQVESQLADCVNCDTAKTTAGQAKIQILSTRVRALKTRLEELESSRRNPPTPSKSELEVGTTVASAGFGAHSPGALGQGLDVTT
jgi:hypothetical protein